MINTFVDVLEKLCASTSSQSGVSGWGGGLVAGSFGHGSVGGGGG